MNLLPQDHSHREILARYATVSLWMVGEPEVQGMGDPFSFSRYYVTSVTYAGAPRYTNVVTRAGREQITLEVKCQWLVQDFPAKTTVQGLVDAYGPMNITLTLHREAL